MSMCEGIAKPFLKWAGGKGQLLGKFAELYPAELLNGEIETYVESFVGGGAALFDALQKIDIKKTVIIDANKELINCYRCIKAHITELIKQLAELLVELGNAGCKVMLSNSDQKNSNPNDNFFDDLYLNYDIQRLT